MSHFDGWRQRKFRWITGCVTTPLRPRSVVRLMHLFGNWVYNCSEASVATVRGAMLPKMAYFFQPNWLDFPVILDLSWWIRIWWLDIKTQYVAGRVCSRRLTTCLFQTNLWLSPVWTLVQIFSQWGHMCCLRRVIAALYRWTLTLASLQLLSHPQISRMLWNFDNFCHMLNMFLVNSYGVGTSGQCIDTGARCTLFAKPQ